LLNVTVVQNGGSGGFVTVYPGDVASPPNASTVNPSTGLDFNFWATGVGAASAGQNAGTIAVFSTHQPAVALDLVGFYSLTNPPDIGNPKFIAPIRVLDPRPTDGGPLGINADGTPVTAGTFQLNQTRRFRLSGQTFPVGLGGAGGTFTFP